MAYFYTLFYLFIRVLEYNCPNPFVTTLLQFIRLLLVIYSVFLCRFTFFNTFFE